MARRRSTETQGGHMKRGRGGTRPDIGIFVRSGWEANYCRYLNLIKSAGLITDWAYEPDTFEFEGIRRGTRFYTPDFKLTHPDGTVEYVEIKGWMDPKSKTKLKRMLKYHPKVTVTVIGLADYLSLAYKWRSKIPNWEGD